MPGNNPRSESNNAVALPWKNSLLTKEQPDRLQMPINYFWNIVHNNDTFSSLFEEIYESREKGIFFEYTDSTNGKRYPLDAFLIIQDQRGCHWICPVVVNDVPFTNQLLRPIKLVDEDPSRAYVDDTVVGGLKISRDDFISACSRGFENASQLFLGKETIKLPVSYRLISAFYFVSSQDTK